jgi:hypothetical protein
MRCSVVARDRASKMREGRLCDRCRAPPHGLANLEAFELRMVE